ncbi:hypothetical protein BDV93DRAFT_545741 [Ceratobasidium sp. AG-I]|nr:hypothetical protein BDV93DRAFT_545741 [Ceratobasidium sp. AG-I]
MFVLQDCSICLDDYDPQRTPHCIPCGHAFCLPCLDSLSASSSSCPYCRAAFDRNSIRKVVCTYQDPPAPSSTALSQAEETIWQSISSTVESSNDHERRRLIVQDNSRLAAREAGFSVNLLVALDVLRLLVDVETVVSGLKQTIDTARAVEASLRERVSFLEERLGSQDLQTILSEMRGMISSINTIDNATSQIAHQLNPPPSPPSPLEEWEEAVFFSGYGQEQNAERRTRNLRAEALGQPPQARTPRSPEHTRTASNSGYTRYPPPPIITSHYNRPAAMQRPDVSPQNRDSTNWFEYNPAWSSSTPLSLLNRVVAAYNVIPRVVVEPTHNSTASENDLWEIQGAMTIY